MDEELELLSRTLPTIRQCLTDALLAFGIADAVARGYVEGR